MFSAPPPPLTIVQKLKTFASIHWRGIVAFLAPIVCIFMLTPFPPEKYQWCAYTLVIMAVYWVSECIPLQVTSFLPVIVFPLTGVMNTRKTCQAYVNDTIIMFLGSIMLASAVEQSGLHKRLALRCIKCIGYSHYKTLFAVCFVTMFISMWITNTAAATLMVPIVFALLRVYEQQGLMRIYEKNASGEQQATELTSCYFCAITFAATIGGVGTLVGTATNLVFKGLFITTYPTAPEYLSFPAFSGFAIPYMLAMNICMYIYLLFMYMGLGRPSSANAKKVKMTKEAIAAAKRAVDKDINALGSITWHEVLVLLLFGGAMAMFFCRSPQIFNGWADLISESAGIPSNFIKDSASAALVVFLMILLPSTKELLKNFTVKNREDLPTNSVMSVINWFEMNKTLPYSFIFLLGGGFALSTAAKKENSDLNGKIGEFLQQLSDLPNAVILLIIIIFTVFVTNFASNVAVCNVIAPIAMELAKVTKQNPLWYNIAAGFSASFCFMIPVGTPGNLIIVAGAGPTVTTIIITWAAIYFYAPIVWPDLHEMPEWVHKRVVTVWHVVPIENESTTLSRRCGGGPARREQKEATELKSVDDVTLSRVSQPQEQKEATELKSVDDVTLSRVSQPQITIDGYDDKQHVLLEKIIEHIVNFKVDPQRFAIMKENHIHKELRVDMAEFMLKGFNAAKPQTIVLWGPPPDLQNQIAQPSSAISFKHSTQSRIEYGRTCKDIGCLNSEVCVLADDPCPIGHTRDCGTYPTCKKKTAVEGSHAEPQPSAPRPTPARPQLPSAGSAPNYPPPAPPAGGSPYGGSPYGGSSPYGNNNGGGSPYGNNNGGGSPYGNNNGGGSPYGGNPYGGNSNGGSNYPGGSPYGGNPYGGSSNPGGSPYGGHSPYGGNSPYGGSTGNRGGNSPYGGTSSGGSSGKKSPLDSIFNTLSNYAGGGGHGTSGGSGGSGLSNIFGSLLTNLSKNGGVNSLFSNTRPIMENPNYSAPSNSRSSNTQHYPSGYQQSYNQPPAQNRNYGQSHAKPNAASTYKPATYGWNVGQYEDVLKQLKWPMVTGADNSPLPKDVLVKFYGLTKFLFLIEEPDDEQARMLSGDFSLENPCLPVKILLRPLKKRFTFHFTGQRQTARLDRPEWFLTQTLTWIKDHQGFMSPTGTRNVPELTSQAAEEAGVWAEAPGLLGRLRDAGLKALVDHAFMEFKAAMREYRRQK
ncbi:hypothetical protein MSG28_004076 [Choristoneura fumiferana]|uniref:Uncharacterized protein n=1 Tax=Choristoneura fumiferana TaxID=7141 RepID=A0ACC0KHV9_CHOFU|nr:hypothetical protein MSG28_004076 [Choristoneura fumiferana]